MSGSTSMALPLRSTLPFRRNSSGHWSGRCTMLRDADPRSFAGIYIVCGRTDLRYGIDSLAAIIERQFHKDLFAPRTLFLFCGRSATKIKGLLWEGDGFLLLYKRVECGHFSWPRNSTELRQLSPEQFKWLMQGFSIDPIIHDVTPKFSA